MKLPEGFLAQRETQDAICVMNGSAQNFGVKTEQWMKHVVHTFLSTMHSLNKKITTLVNNEHHRAKNGHKMTKSFFKQIPSGLGKHCRLKQILVIVKYCIIHI